MLTSQDSETNHNFNPQNAESPTHFDSGKLSQWSHLQPFKDKAQTALFKDPVRTALQTLFISVIKTNQFIL
jgi:hypothetical protein